MLFLLLLAGSLFLPMNVGAQAQTLRVSENLPLVGKSMTLQVRAEVPLADGVKVEYVAQSLLDVEQKWQKTVTVTTGKVDVKWVPLTPGPYRITATLDGQTLPAQEIFAVGKRLHLNFWNAPLTQKYVTSVLDTSKDSVDTQKWLDRGVIPCSWRTGALDYYDKVEQWLEEFSRPMDGRTGMMLDEFWGAGEPPHHDELAGEAMLQFRTMQPEVFQAPYCLTLGRNKMREVFAQSDLVLVELYRKDFRSHESLSKGMQPFIDAGINDHSIPVLGAGPSSIYLWITTEAELRRQIAYIRYAMPDCPGVGIFPEFYPGLSEAFDRAVYDYFLAPALLLRDGMVLNIGQLPARNIRLVKVDGTEETVPVIWPNGQKAVDAGVKIVPAEGYTVVEYRKPLPTDRPTAQAAEVAREFMQTTGKQQIPIADFSRLVIERATSEKADVNGQVNGASLAMDLPKTGPVGLSFQIKPNKAYFYGRIGVWLAGNEKTRLGVSFCHADHDSDVSANNPRAEFEAWADDKTALADCAIPGLEVGETYSIFAGWDGKETAWFVLSTTAGEMLWESGPLHFTGPMTLNRLQIEVMPFDTSNVAAEGSIIHARGVSGGENPSLYVLDADISKVIVLQ